NQEHILAAKFSDQEQTISYLLFRRNVDRAIILGDPGSGKSTLTQLLSFDLARLISLEDSTPSRSEYENSDLKVPLRIILRSFEARRATASSYTFFDYLRDELKTSLES